MQLAFEEAWKSITGPVTTGDLANFIVITGLNGAGKTHLLEAIREGKTYVDVEPHDQGEEIRFFGLAQAARSNGRPHYGRDEDELGQIANRIESTRRRLTSPPVNLAPASDELDRAMYASLTDPPEALSTAVLDKLCLNAERRLSEIEADDVQQFAPLLVDNRDLFGLQAAEVFLAYERRRAQNTTIQLLQREGRFDRAGFTDEEFLVRYGPPPWELLNDTLRIVELPYEFHQPDTVYSDLVYRRTTPFAASLKDTTTGRTVTSEDLSTGEQILLAIAMSLYMAAGHHEAVRFPRVLLLDEADAGLHPAMVQRLLQIVEEQFVFDHGIKVILTTHTPTTVALAPEDALYVMRRSGDPRLRKVTRDEALSEITVGLSTLSVSVDNRRQVFVESKYDEQCYQELFRIVRYRLGTPLSLEFIASGKDDRGGGCDAVKRLVTSLREAGNTTVFGIVDRDQRLDAPEGIKFVASRYAIENCILDPLLVGCLLLREGICTASDMGLPADRRSHSVNPSEVQVVVDWVVDVASESADDMEPVVVWYLDGSSATVPRWWLDLRGHDLEERLRDRWKALKALKKPLMVHVVTFVIADTPQYTPRDAIDLFRSLLLLADGSDSCTSLQ